jgi:hypothetical protein
MGTLVKTGLVVIAALIIYDLIIKKMVIKSSFEEGFEE